MSSVESFLEDLAKNYGFSNVKLNSERGSEKGDNYVGEISTVQITGDLKGAPSTLQVVVKSATKSQKSRDAIPTRDIFIREIFAYSEVIPVLDKLQGELQEIDRFRFAKCYATNKEDLNELLVLEDMMQQGFRMHKPRLDTLDFDHYSVALTDLAKYHALSYVLQERNPQVFAELANGATDYIYSDSNSSVKKFAEKGSDQALNAMKDDKLREKLQPLANNTHHIMGEFLVPNKFSVLCHGDYWKNNMLFAYQNGKPVWTCPLDYQLLRYSSPVTDVMYFLFCCSSKQLRNKHFWHLISLYHDALGDQLKRFSMDVEKVFPKSEFMAEVKRLADFGLASAMCVLMFMTCDTEDVPEPSDLLDGEVKAYDVDSDSYKRYSERITDLVEDCIQFGFL